MASDQPLLPAEAPSAEEVAAKAKEDEKQKLKTQNDEKQFTEEGNSFKDRKEWLLAVPKWFESQGMKPDKDVIDACITRTELSLKVWSSKDELSKEGSDVEDHSVGPALMLTFIANRITWTFFTVLPWAVGLNWVFFGGESIISCAASTTEGAEAPLPFATYPKSLWLIFFSVTGLLLHYEMRAFSHASVAQVVVSGIPKLGKWKPSYAKYLLVMLIISVVYHFDIFTNGIFIARVLVTNRCVAGENATVTPERIWNRTISASALSSLSGFTFFQWCVAAWASLYLQPLYSWGFAVPRSPQLQDPEPKESDPGNTLKPVDYTHKPAENDCPVYEVTFRGDQQHGRALQAMAESARMNSLYFMDPDYMTYQTKSWKPTDVHREMQRTNARFFIFIVETMLPPNLQATFLCFEKAMSYNPEHPDAPGFRDYIILVSVIFSFITGVIYVRSELTAVLHFHGLIKHQKWKFENWAEHRPDQVSREAKHKAQSALFKAKRSLIICFFLAGVGMFFLSYAVLKAIMGCFVCPMGMWNLKFPLADGCVDLTEIYG